MKSDPSTWYLLQDGTYAEPSECKADAAGVLRNKNGLAVALREDGSPQTVASGAIDNKNVEAAAAGKTEPVREPAQTGGRGPDGLQGERGIDAKTASDADRTTTPAAKR